MNWPDIIEKLKNVNIKERRFNGPEYYEWVVDKKEIHRIRPVLEEFFGPAFDFKGPAAQKVQNFINDFGGVRKGQVLFFNQTEEAVFYALIWPWSDNYSVTLRIEQLQGRKAF